MKGKNIRKDLREYYTKRMKDTIECNNNKKALKSKMSPESTKITRIINKQPTIVCNGDDIEKVIQDFYKTFHIPIYQNYQYQRPEIVGAEEISGIDQRNSGTSKGFST